MFDLDSSKQIDLFQRQRNRAGRGKNRPNPTTFEGLPQPTTTTQEETPEEETEEKVFKWNFDTGEKEEDELEPQNQLTRSKHPF